MFNYLWLHANNAAEMPKACYSAVGMAWYQKTKSAVLSGYILTDFGLFMNKKLKRERIRQSISTPVSANAVRSK